MVFGLIPSWQASRLDLVEALKQGTGGGGSGGGRSRLGARGVLVVAEVAMALVLLTGAGLLTRNFVGLLRWDPGFDRNGLLTVWALFPREKYEDGVALAAFQQRAAEEIETIPSVISAGTASAGPLFGGLDAGELLVVGRPVPAAGEQPQVRWFDIGPSYFRTLGTPIVRGRDFTERDTRGAPNVAIVNETLAREFWPGEDPLGEQVTIAGANRTIVGVVVDVPSIEPGTPAPPYVHWPQLQAPRGATFFVIRTDADPAAIVRAVRARLQALEPDMQLSRFATMDDLVGQRVVRPRFTMLLLGIFAAVALLLAAVGIYGVVSYSVVRRTRELGIRMALGAAHRDIVGAVVRHGMAPSLLGIGLGLVGAAGLTRVLSRFLYGVASIDPATFAVVSLLLAAVAALACYVPARRATKVDPIIAVKTE